LAGGLDPEAVDMLALRLASRLKQAEFKKFNKWLNLTSLRRLMAVVLGKFRVRVKWVSLIDTFPFLVSSACQPSMLSASMRGFDYKQTFD